MSDKVFNLICGITTGVEAIAIAIVGFCVPAPLGPVICAAIPIACEAVKKICSLFVKKD